MQEYLSKEEIRQWRSSLERITLEEFAARLGKAIQGEKQTNDMVDKVMSRSLNSFPNESYQVKNEKIQTIALKSFEKEKELMQSKPETKIESKQNNVTTQAKIAQIREEIKPQIKETDKETAKSELNLTFKKSLTVREQLIFDHFLLNKNTIIYAKDLAKLLELPRDYVYKYIKNLRSKLNEDVLYNADNGGYVLKV